MIRKMIGHSKNHLARINIKIKIMDESLYTDIWDVSIYNDYRDVAVLKYRTFILCLYSIGRILYIKRVSTWDLSPRIYTYLLMSMHPQRTCHWEAIHSRDLSTLDVSTSPVHTGWVY